MSRGRDFWDRFPTGTSFTPEMPSANACVTRLPFFDLFLNVVFFLKHVSCETLSLFHVCCGPIGFLYVR